MRSGTCRTLTLLLLGAALVPAASYPKTEISNGVIRAVLYLPDVRSGYYRGTRFDWSGVIGSLIYKGHDYYGPWFARVDDKVHDFVYVGPDVVAGACSAITGPVEEFGTDGTALGWNDAKPGGTFIKIGVGALRKDDKPYDFVKLYPMVDEGKWTVVRRRDSVEFTHELKDASSGYGYVYRKVVRLVPGKPEMVLEHSLKNTGAKAIRSTVYNHNFLVLDHQAPGPDFTISVPFRIQSRRPPNKNLAAIRGNQIVYLKTLECQETVSGHVGGFSDSPRDHEIRIENRKVGAGLKITGDRPLSNENLWSIRTVLAIEPFIRMFVEPGREFTWKDTYQYYTLPAGAR